MSRRMLVVLAALLALAVAAPAQVKTWKEIPTPPLPPFKPQQPVRVQLPNGMVLFLQEDHELPVIDGVMRIHGGARTEPANKVGMLDIYGDVWRTGGTRRLTGDQMDDFLEARAAKLETGSSADSSFISWASLKGDFDEVFKLFLELLREPAFREDKLALAKKQLDTGIARRNDDIGDIAGRESVRLAYGKENPYARIPEYATVAAVTRDDLVKWHQEHVHPNRIIIGIVGDFDAKQMEARLRQAFASWPKGPEVKKPDIRFEEPRPGVYFIPKEDVNQSSIRMVTLGTTRDNPDYFAIVVMNEILGGGFSSRLFTNVRSKKGLAYNVGGGVGTAFDHPGIFRVSMGTKSGSTREAVEALFSELNDIVSSPPTAEELKRAKDSILNSFIFNFDTPEKVLRERMAYEFYGYPADFLERYRAGIEKATAQDVARVARKYVPPKSKLAVLVVGNPAELGDQLAKLGPVTQLDITIPAPGGAQAKPAGGGASGGKPAPTTPEARALMAKVVESMGGAAKVQSVKAVRQRATSLRKTPQGEMPFEIAGTVVFPDRIHAVMSTPMGEMTMVVTPQNSFMSAAGAGVRDLPPSVRDEGLKGLKREHIYVAQHVADPQYSFALEGTENIAGTETSVLVVNTGDSEVRWNVDPSGRVVRATFTAMSNAGPVQRQIDYSDWKTVQGLSVPFQRTVTENGEVVSRDEATQVEINPTVDPSLFQKPAAAQPSAAPK